MRVDHVTEIRKEREPGRWKSATIRERRIAQVLCCTLCLGLPLAIGSAAPARNATDSTPPPGLLEASHATGYPLAKPLLSVFLLSSTVLLVYRYWKRRAPVPQRKGGSRVRSQNPFQPIALKPTAASLPVPSLPASPGGVGNLRQLVGHPPPATGQSQGVPATPTAENFIYAAAHDLREPLRKVRLFLSRLEQKTAAEDLPRVQPELEGLRITVNRMQGLLDSLLSLARIEGRGVSFELTDLTEVLKQVLADLETTILETNAEISIEGSLPQLAADRTQLQQLLQNLISNALKFRKPGNAPRIRITVSAFPERPVNDHPSDRTWCEIAIRDEGIGFESVYWEQMLQGFQRLNSRDQYEGTGLGLAICRCIIERHQGSLNAESAPGQGTTVRVRLPMQQHARSGDTTMLVGPALGKDPAQPGPKHY